MRRILILAAHPSPRRSEAGVALTRRARAVDGVTLVDLYADYPRFDIDIDREQGRLARADIVVFLHPLFWYSTPALLKEWQDLVLEYGYAYGPGGDALKGKIFLSALTAGGKASAYQSGGHNNFPIRELLRPLEQTANLCGMVYLPPFALFAARRAADDGRLTAHEAAFARLLEALRDETLDMDAARALDHLGADALPIRQEA